MLTEKALNERMWGKYPTLRKILEQKKIPDEYYGSTSVTDNIFDRNEGLLKLIILLVEFSKRNEELDSVSSEKLIIELKSVMNEIDSYSEYMERQRCKIQELINKLNE